MAEGILTNVLLQSADLLVRSSRVGPLAPATGTPILTPEPLRMLALVVPDDALTKLFVAPNEQTLSGPVLKSGDGAPLLIHASTFPGLVRLPWWVVSDSADTLTVYEVLRIG